MNLLTPRTELTQTPVQAAAFQFCTAVHFQQPVPEFASISQAYRLAYAYAVRATALERFRRSILVSAN